MFAEGRPGDVYDFPEIQFYIHWADVLQLSPRCSSGVTPDPSPGRGVISCFISFSVK